MAPNAEPESDAALPSTAAPRRGAAVLRWWPAVAALFGVAGLAMAGTTTTFAIAAMLVVCSLALELGGWAELARSHGRRLGTAALCGALVGAAIVTVAHARDVGATPGDRIALRD